MAVIPFPMPEAMLNEVPGVTAMTRVFTNPMTLTAGDRQFREIVVSVDPGFFKLIRLPLVAGDPDTVFRQPQSLVLSQSAAHKYFGDANPIGRTITTGRTDCADADTACRSPDSFAESDRGDAGPAAQQPADRRCVSSQHLHRGWHIAGDETCMVRPVRLWLCQAGAGHRSAMP